MVLGVEFLSLYDVKWDATLRAGRDREELDVCWCGSSPCRVEVEEWWVMSAAGR